MIVFKTLRYKNFLSTGNDFTTIDLNDSKSTLIVGHNGAGKSTLLDAMSFALFGKPHRNINKPQLVNSINAKDCLVEIEFSIGKSNFKVIRGIKPGIFEIWKNNVLINQSSHSKEYQKILEQNILKLNHKSFHQIVVLGSSSFIPFMQLPSQHRRDVIEDLLDINVFSKMNSIVKERNASLKEKLKDVTYEIDLSKNKVESQRKYIRDITRLNDDQIGKIQENSAKCAEEIKALQAENNEHSTFIGERQESVQADLKKNHDKKQSLLHYVGEFRQKQTQVVKDAKFYENMDECPTCTQTIDDVLRKSKMDTAKSKARELMSALKKAEESAGEIEKKIGELNAIQTEINEKISYINANNNTISRLQRQINDNSEEIKKIQSTSGDLSKANNDLADLSNTGATLVESKLKMNDELAYNSVMAEMLKDTGIKTKVIKQYLPVINNLVNQYLQTLDFFVHFNLDESFQETIRSRHRDTFSYASFSEGEKQRIDLALLFTWRMVAKMKNSVATNLLVLDETFDSSLDHEGVDNLMKILYTLDDDTNVFVISHKGEILDGKFRHKLEFVKDKNFSKVKDDKITE